MSKPIDAPDLPLVPLWDDRAPDDLSRPDASFHDDHVGGRLKAEEAARQRAVADRFLQTQPKRIVDEGIKVVEAGAFRPTHEDEAQNRARREGNRQVRQGRRPSAGQSARPVTQQEMDLSRVEARVEHLMSDMQALDEAYGAAEEDILNGQNLEAPSAQADRAQQQAMRLLKLEREAKFALQHLLAGGIGMTFLADPRVTFRRLLARIAKWPAGVRPGYKPETDADIDAFLAWVFEPEGGYASVEPF